MRIARDSSLVSPNAGIRSPLRQTNIEVYLKLLSYMLENRIDRPTRPKELPECHWKKLKKLMTAYGVWNHIFFPLGVEAVCA